MHLATDGHRFALTRLKEMKNKYPVIGDIRGIGFMIGIEFVNKDKSPNQDFCKKVCKSCEENGLILIECGIDKNIIRFMPPLITTKSEMEMALEIFEDALSR